MRAPGQRRSANLRSGTNDEDEIAMRHQFTPGQIRMLIQRAEIQFDNTIAQSLVLEPGGKHVARALHAALHETVVGLIKLFRDQVPGAAEVATQLARLYAKGADARAGAPTLDCLRRIADVTREARERYLPPPAPPPAASAGAPARR
jgi:hypothetical protein